MTQLYRILALMAILCSGFAMPLAAKDFTVVIDAGHGGHDYGAIGLTTNEKTINLGVALKLGDLIKANIPGVNIVYTRSTDVFKELQERARIANKAQGDLFISIHTNSVDKSNKRRTTITGASTYTLGLHRSAENLEVAKRENAVITLENDFSTTYQGFDPNSTESYIMFELSQNRHMEQSIDFASRVQTEMARTAGRVNQGVRQAGFLVLARTSMPAVLVELDFICNPTAETFLASDAGQDKFAAAIFNALAAYKTAIDRRSGKATVDPPIAPIKPESLRSDTLSATQQVVTQPVAVAADSEESIVYKIQILSSPQSYQPDAPRFKGLTEVQKYRDGELWKYTVGSYSGQADAAKELRAVRKLFPDAFIIATRAGKRIK